MRSDIFDKYVNYMYDINILPITNLSMNNLVSEEKNVDPSSIEEDELNPQQNVMKVAEACRKAQLKQGQEYVVGGRSITVHEDRDIGFHMIIQSNGNKIAISTEPSYFVTLLNDIELKLNDQETASAFNILLQKVALDLNNMTVATQQQSVQKQVEALKLM